MQTASSTSETNSGRSIEGTSIDSETEVKTTAPSVTLIELTFGFDDLKVAETSLNLIKNFANDLLLGQP